MKRKWIGFIISVMVLVTVIPTPSFGEIPAMAASRVVVAGGRKVGETISASDIRRVGAKSYFTSAVIDNTVFKRMKGKSFGTDCTTKREDLRYLNVLYYGIDGNTYLGELVCHKSISEDLLSVFKELYDIKFPIQSMRLVDDYEADDIKSAEANNTSCFNFRISAGDSGQLSRHSYGLAIDINPLYNPYVWYDKDDQVHYEPEKGKAYADRTKEFAQKLTEDSECVKIFKKHGFSWGGDWARDKDYMHFSKPLPKQ